MNKRVLSFLGSFAQIRGVNHYLELIQDTPEKPLRVFLVGDGGHDPNHGGAILPDALRWL